MPQYLYKCNDSHTKPMIHRMMYGTAVLCECGGEMWRVPQVQRVVWGGLPPHMEHYIGPVARDLVSDRTQGELKEAYAAKKAARGEEYIPA